MGGTPQGAGTACLGDADGDGRDDACGCGPCRVFGDHGFPFCLTPPDQPDVDDITCCVAGFANCNDCPSCDMVRFTGECNPLPCASSTDCEAFYGVPGIPCKDGFCCYIDVDEISYEVDAFGGCTGGLCCPDPCPPGACCADFDGDGDQECIDGTGVDPNTGQPTGFGMSESDCIDVSGTYYGGYSTCPQPGCP
jgi:hypothetical protein